MTRFQLDMWPTGSGAIAAYSALPRGSNDRPAVVLLHGALRNAEFLTPWGERLSDVADVVLMDLPGHGRSKTTAPLSIPQMADELREAICAGLAERRVLIVGESLGGTVALAIGGLGGSPVRAVFAADPAMTTGKLWPVINVFRSHMGKSDEPALADRLGRDAFGVTPSGVQDLIYYPLLGNLAVPAVIATGDLPLLPPRQMAKAPCLFDAVDRFVLKTFYPGKARFKQIDDCGHVVLTDAPEACRTIILEMLEEISGSAGPAQRGVPG